MVFFTIIKCIYYGAISVLLCSCERIFGKCFSNIYTIIWIYFKRIVKLLYVGLDNQEWTVN